MRQQLLLVGVALLWAGLALPPVRPFLEATLIGHMIIQIPMLVVMGWLYVQSPVRLCNNYLFDQQTALGRTLWAVAGAVAAYGLLKQVFRSNGDAVS